MELCISVVGFTGVAAFDPVQSERVDGSVLLDDHSFTVMFQLFAVLAPVIRFGHSIGP